MIIDRTHVKWGVATAVVSLVATGVYLANTNPALMERWHLPSHLPEKYFGHSPPLTENIGSTPLGLFYGTVALLIFIFAALLGARRNHPTWKVGRIRTWLKAHIWFTIFTIPLVIFHCGTHWGGPMTSFLLWLYIFVMASGFFGLFLQNIMPRLMRDRLPEEVIFEQIPFIRQRLYEQAKEIRDEIPRRLQDVEVDAHASDAEEEAEHATVVAPAALKYAAVQEKALEFIDEEVLPFLDPEYRDRSILRNREAAEGEFRLVRLQLPEFLHPEIYNLQQICDDKRRVDTQARMHYWLHTWLVLHAPSSLLLVVMTLVHAVVGLFIYD
jgi:hypothetical protein